MLNFRSVSLDERFQEFIHWKEVCVAGSKVEVIVIPDTRKVSVHRRCVASSADVAVRQDSCAGDGYVGCRLHLGREAAQPVRSVLSALCNIVS